MTADHPSVAPTLKADLSPADRAWLDSIGWSDAAVPPIADQVAAERYARIEAAIAKASAALSYAERGESLEGRLAAALGARLADWRERDEDKDD